MKPVRAVVGGGLLVGAALLALVPTSAQATTLTQAGWWWRANDGELPATLPAPPNVPEGGLMVAGAPDGATAIAALHFDLSADEASPVLTLVVAEKGDQGGDTAVLAACLTGSAWQPASGGTWTNKPFPACAEGSVSGVRSEDGKTWTFALAPLLSDGIVDVTVVPGVDPTVPEGANGSVFQLAFNAPTAASLTTTSGAGSGADLVLPEFGSDDLGSIDGTSFETPSVGGDLALPPAPSFTPALPEGDQGLTATAPVVQERNAPLEASPASAVADHKALATVVLALCGGVMLWSAQLPVPEPAGLGRFARPRSGAAPRL
jgi:hypothetical protein